MAQDARRRAQLTEEPPGLRCFPSTISIFINNIKGVGYDTVTNITSYPIFVHTTGGTCGEKFAMWKKFRFLHITYVEKSEISSHLACRGSSDSPHDKDREIWHFPTSFMYLMWRMSPNHTQCVPFCCKICRNLPVLS